MAKELHKIICLLFILLLSGGVFTNCSKEKFAATKYPRIVTRSAARINDSTVSFNGEILSGDLSQITEYGFVWDEYSPEPYIETSDKLTITGSPQSGSFSSNVENLVNGRHFNFRAYVKTKDYLIYGNVLNY
jgi:hypothetical protein